MKKVFVVLAFLVIGFIVNAQYALDKGKVQLNAGAGLGWGLSGYVGLDLGIHRDISIGAEASFRTWGEDVYHDGAYVIYHHFIPGITFNGNYHFTRLFKMPEEWDVYAGGNIGYYIWVSPNGYSGNHKSTPGFGGQIGGRYYFKKNFALNAELGGGNTNAGGKFGISYIF